MNKCRECVILGRQCDECMLRAELAEYKQAVRDLRALVERMETSAWSGRDTWCSCDEYTHDMSVGEIDKVLAATAHLVAE